MALLRGSPSKQLIFKCWYLLTRTASGPKARLRNSSYEYLWIIIWWASPTVRLAIHSQLFTWTYLFGYRGWSKLHVEGGMVLNPKHPGTPPEVWYDWTPKTYKYQTPSLKRGYIAWMSIGCFSPHGTCQVLLLVLRRTTIVPRKRCQVMSKNSVAGETRIRRLVRIGGLNARSFGSGGYDFAGK